MNLKFKSCVLFTVLCAVLTVFSNSVGATSDGVTVSEIEQVYVNMPEIRAYFSNIDESQAKKENIAAFCEDRTLECVETVRFSETNDGTDYYIILDTSASVGEEVFSQAKNSVISLSSRLGDKDRLSVISFGSDVKEEYRSDKKEKELSLVLDGLRATSNKTSLYSALAFTARLADGNNSSEYKRHECILFTDGYDFAAGKETIEETEEQLLKYNIPVYTVSFVRSASEENQKLGELSRRTGGRILIPESESEVMNSVNEIYDEIQNSYAVVFRAKNNIVNNSENNFSVKFIDKDITKVRRTYMFRWQPDTVPPVLTKAVLEGCNTVKLYFSEDVINADNADCYCFVDSAGRAVIPEKAAYEENANEYISVLTFRQDIIKGDYKIICKNISDRSMEKNSIDGELQVYFDGAEPQNEFIVFITSWKGIVLIAAAAVITAGVIVTFIVLIRWASKKKRSDEDYEYDEQSFGYQYPVEQAYPLSGVINLQIELEGGGFRTTELKLENKLIAGRSKACDICIDDQYMARKQFIIERENNGCYISDLASTNGTFVNGVRLSSKVRLNVNDVITAGKARIIIAGL